MFLKMLLLFFLWGVCSPAANACTTGEHHSTAYHYNNAKKVFVGKLLHRKVHQSDRVWLTFRVEQPYRHCQVGELVKLLANRYNTALIEKNSRHLIYAEVTPSAALYCPQLEPFNDSNTTRQIDFIKKIRQQPLGKLLTEYSPLGGVWATGYYTDGEPYHTWRYYAYSGELKLEGGYSNGLRSGQWRGKIHTNDDEYTVLHGIMTGAYARLWDDYAVLGIDTSAKEKYRYTLRYTVETETMTEQFYYNEPYRNYVCDYTNGLRDGREVWYNEQGLYTRGYSFKMGYLEGQYQEKIPMAKPQKGYIEVKGSYAQDHREEEIHYYYNENGHYLYRKVIVEAGKTLPEPRLDYSQ